MASFDSEVLKNKFSVLNINVRSLRANFEGLQCLLDDLKYKVSIIVVTETWLSTEHENIHILKGYKVAYTSRNSHGGGLAIFYIDTLNVAVEKVGTGLFSSHEGLCIEVNIDTVKFKILAVYRPPNNAFFTHIKN